MPTNSNSHATDIDPIVEGIDSFLNAEVIPRHETFATLLESPRRTFGADGTYVPEVRALVGEVRQASAAAGYYTMGVPESLGGGGLGRRVLYHAWEHIFRTCGPRYWLGTFVLAHWTKGPSVLLSYLQEELRARVLPSLMEGKATLCFAMSEPDAGSDVWNMRTRATRSGDNWIVSGTKQWISNAPYADFAVVFAVTDPAAVGRRRGGITAFFVPTASPGFSVDAVTPMFGHVGSNEGIVGLDDVVVPGDHVVGELDHGMALGLTGVSMGRTFNAARAVGLGRWALERAISYTADRVTFGERLSARQGVSFPLAESAMELHAARLMAINCVDLLDRGEPALKELAMTKAFTTEVSTRAIDRAMQAHGAIGFTNELGIAEAWQEVRRAHVADGSAEVMRRQIARQLYKGDLDL